MTFRTGLGYDIHPLRRGHKLILGGIEIPSEKGEVGHSDGDVLIHAIVDALLGTISAGDIGTLFPDTDPQYKNAKSRIFLEKTLLLLSEKDFHINNMDATIVLEAPRLQPHIRKIRHHLAEITNIPVDQVSVKATTNEKLGYIGKGEGIACYANVLVYNDK
ncbi:MAG: 2-C-methyl-D-erythritol 2,4-cyclodiphosphate synthase [Chlorobi bacterium]|nr:2-C-methyl-D-erythritol 2,4-cyclodiphosphate synthase [Chlorobiota bacterium]